jgi:hypothetical protein
MLVHAAAQHPSMQVLGGQTSIAAVAYTRPVEKTIANSKVYSRQRLAQFAKSFCKGSGHPMTSTADGDCNV